jgi:60 kDa SS-A/Ro ribonucleoprotein
MAAQPQSLTAAPCGRFLLTGCDSGIYDASSFAPAPQRARSFLRALTTAGFESVRPLLAAPQARPEAALFALALAASPRFSTPESVAQALAALPQLAPKAHDLAIFSSHAGQLRGWGRGLRSAVSAWYRQQPLESLAAQILRRPVKNLATHRNLLRKAHPAAASPEQNALFQWIVNGGELGHLASPELLSGSLRLADGFARAHRADTEREVLRWIEDARLQPHHVPRHWKASPRIWEALFDHLTYRQMLRCLPEMTSCGFLSSASEYTAIAVARLADRRRVHAASLTPLRLIQAMCAYRANTSQPVESLFDALDEALHLSFGQSLPARKSVVVALDASGSMQGAPTLGILGVSAALSGTVLAMALARAAGGGGRQCVPLAFHRQARTLQSLQDTSSRLTAVLNEVRARPSRSEPSSVIQYALENRVDAGAFVVITDRIHRKEASSLACAFHNYRQRSGSDAKLVLVALAGGDLESWDAEATSPGENPCTLAVSGMNTGHALRAIVEFVGEPHHPAEV